MQQKLSKDETNGKILVKYTGKSEIQCFEFIKDKIYGVVMRTW